MVMTRWLQSISSLFSAVEKRLGRSGMVAAGATLAGTIGVACAAAGESSESSPQLGYQAVAYDSTVSRISEKFILTPAESVVVRCDTIRYRRVAPASVRTTAPRVPSSGAGHGSHGSHASHASHSSHSSGGWV